MILWTIRISAILYVLALVQMIRGRDARLLWTAGCVMFLAHVAAAFEWAHHWSHEAAVRETARQTKELFGLDWGGGIWFNYVFTAIWTADVLWWWVSPASRGARPAWVGRAIHIYMAWMFVNGAIVFPTGFVRWIFLAIALSLFSYWLTVLRQAARCRAS